MSLPSLCVKGECLFCDSPLFAKMNVRHIGADKTYKPSSKIYAALLQAGYAERRKVNQQKLVSKQTLFS
jgi:hypothetical protein